MQLLVRGALGERLQHVRECGDRRGVPREVVRRGRGDLAGVGVLLGEDHDEVQRGLADLAAHL
eukprot:11010146-Alexandrium_andersonii.AAC.1